MVETVPPTEAHVDDLAANLRQQDVDELNAAGHTDHRAVIAEGVARSDWSVTALVDGQLACIFGLARMGSLLAPVGVPWMLGTDLVPRNRRALARLAPHYIRVMLQDYPRLVNTVHARTTVAVAWLKHVGFTLHPATPTGVGGEMFHLFEMRRDDPPSVQTV